LASFILKQFRFPRLPDDLSAPENSTPAVSLRKQRHRERVLCGAPLR
jgi:hypothetical protein